MHHGWTGVAFAALLLAAPAGAQGQLAVEHGGADVAEVAGAGNGNGVPEPGERLTITPRVVSAEPATIEGATATLVAADATVSVEDAAAAYGPLVFGSTTTASDPFAVAVAASHPCGAPLRFAATLTTAASGADLMFDVPTGVPGARQAFDSTAAPAPIPDGWSYLDAPLDVAAAGHARGVGVRMAVEHPYPPDLRAELIAPDGRRATVPLAGGEVPALDGSPVSGTWRLRLTDSGFGDAGALMGWGLDLAPGVCADPTAPPPVDDRPGNGAGHGYGHDKPCRPKPKRPC